MRRNFIIGTLAAAMLACTGTAALAQAPKVIKISHQFPGGTIDEGDFRDRLTRKFAAEVEKRSNGALKVEVYPASSLVKTFAQFGALRKGALDMSVLPVAYGGGEVPEANLGLMVNYLYEPKDIEDNVEAHIRDGSIITSAAVRRLAR